MHPAFIPICILAALGVRLAIIVLFPVEPFSDSAWYVAKATELSQGMGYQEGGYPTAFWPVGWPAILAGAIALFKSVSVSVAVLNLSAAAVIVALILWYGRHVIGNEKVARLALLAYAVYPNHIVYTGVAATETVYTALAMLAFALLIGGRNKKAILLISGFLFGVATLIKPQTIAFPFGAVIALVLVYQSYTWRRAVLAGVIVYCSLLLVVLPWTLRNVSTFGEFVLVSTNSGYALFLGANDEMTGDDYAIRETDTYRSLGINWEEHVERQVDQSHVLKDYALNWIGENTLEYIAWMPRKVALLWIKDTDGFWAYDHSYSDASFLIRSGQIINQIYYLAILLLALPAAFLALLALLRQSESQMKIGLLFCFPVFVSLLAAVFTGQIRYHFSAMPFLIIAAAWTVFWLIDKRGSSYSTLK